jgi:hypothetical protein
MLIVKSRASTLTRIRRIGAVLVIAAFATAGTLLTTALTASGHAAHHRLNRKLGFAVLAHPVKHAHVASANQLQAPPGAALGAVVGNHALYAWQREVGKICLVNIDSLGGSGGACSATASAEEKGVDLITLPVNGHTLSVALLLPNGVSAVTFTDRDGSTNVVNVTNNVVEDEDENLAAVNYTMPSGASEGFNVAELVDRQRSGQTAG